MVVKKTEPIKLEFVVRGYITGSTTTSLWTLYNANISKLNNMYSINLRTGYKKNEMIKIIKELKYVAYDENHNKIENFTNKEYILAYYKIKINKLLKSY